MKTASGFLETNGARIYYEVEGEGEPVVLIHAGIANLRMRDEHSQKGSAVSEPAAHG